MPKKLTPAEVSDIRQALAEGSRTRDLARWYQVSTETIRRVARGDTWGEFRDTAGKPPPTPEDISASQSRLTSLLTSQPDPQPQEPSP